MSICILVKLLIFVLVGYSAPAFVGESSCQKCHAEEFKLWSKSHHGTTLSFDEQSMIPREVQPLQYENNRAKFKSHIINKKLYLHEFIKSSQVGTNYHFDFSIGSNTRGKSFVNVYNDKAKLLPFSIINNEWSFEDSDAIPENITFRKTVVLEEKCLFCHALTTDLQSLVKSKFNGISCEKCHGSAELHVQSPQKNNIQKNIYPPEKFGICTSCHTAEQKSIQAIHANQTFLLEQSKCFKETDNLSCLSCHSAHSLQVKVESCTQCHKPSQKHFDQKLSKCVNCHMPKKEIGMKLDNIKGEIFHPKVRDHFIKK